MTYILTLINSSAYFDPLHGATGWIGFLALWALLISLLWQTRHANTKIRKEKHTGLILGLVIGEIIFSLMIGVRLPPGSALPPPELAIDPPGPAIMIFSALPWLLAGGLFGPLTASGLALLSGLLQGYFDHQNLILSLEPAFLAIFFSLAIRQRYRTPAFHWLRFPLVAAGLVTLSYIFLDLLLRPLSVSGSTASRLDYTLTNLPVNTLAVGIEMFVAGLVSQWVAHSLPTLWGKSSPLLPSPSERSLRVRFLMSLAPVAFVAVITLMIGDWLAADWTARDMLRGQMSTTANLAVESIPYFFETGQILISQLVVDPRLLSNDPNELSKILSEDIRRVTFFTQLSLLNTESQVLASYPSADFVGPTAPIEEITGVQIAIRDGVPFQTFTIPPAAGQSSALVSFVAAVKDEQQNVRAVLVGRCKLEENPFTRPILNSLESLTQDNGIGMLLDEEYRILVHPDASTIMTRYNGPMPEQPMLVDDTAPDGTRMLTYFHKVKGRPWSVVLSIPARNVQQYALNIAAPLLAIVLVISIIAIIVSRLSLKVVTASLQNLTQEANRLAQGRLDQPLSVQGVDEVGQLGHSFEQMRVSLKARLDELNRLLVVSQGVASSLEMSEAVQPVLESALAGGASSARVVLTPTVIPELDGETSTPISFGAGVRSRLYSSLDEQILAITRQQERLVQSNTKRPRLLNFPPGSARPESLIAIALRHENLYYGSLWVAFEKAHAFSEENVRFIVTLASQAALAAANTRLFMNAEVGRQRLASILASSPDPVLVTDQRDRLLLANPAAWQAMEIGAASPILSSGDEGQPIEQIVSKNELLDLLRSSNTEKETQEVILPDGRVYLATATSVLAEGQRVGRVCVMRDVTHFKELDALKSEFVSTVSHDLRSPLTLMRGYTTMLEMVGQLNEQQVGYVHKIIEGVENMSRLVNNLLDLGRIDAGVGLQLEMISVNNAVEKVINSLQLQAAQKHITLTFEMPQQTIPLIEADQALLQQALQNLIENAIKYTRPEGKVHVNLQVRASGMHFQVSDTGIGISPMDLPRLFEKFYRGAQQAAREQRGTGLGLAIVKSIADRHGGEVRAESQLGKGSTFTLIIPLRQLKH